MNNNSDEDISQYYDNRYTQGYRDNLSGYELSRCAAIKDFFLTIFPHDRKNLSICDYGSGSGAHITLWESIFDNSNLYFSDISNVALKKLQSNHSQYSNNTSLIIDGKTNFCDNTFDIVVSVEVMEHVLNLDEYLKEIFRIIKPGGFFFWTTPCANKNSIEEIYSRVTGQIEFTSEGYVRWKWEDPGHVRRLKSSQLLDKLAKIGFFLPKIYFRSHFFSFLCSKIFIGPLAKFSHNLINLDWTLFKKFQNGASMVGIVKKRDET